MDESRLKELRAKRHQSGLKRKLRQRQEKKWKSKQS